MNYKEAIQKMKQGYIIICTSIEDHNEYCIFGDIVMVIENKSPLKLVSKSLHSDDKYNYEIAGYDERFKQDIVESTRKTQKEYNRKSDRITPLKHEYWTGTQEQYDNFYQYM